MITRYCVGAIALGGVIFPINAAMADAFDRNGQKLQFSFVCKADIHETYSKKSLYYNDSVSVSYKQPVRSIYTWEKNAIRIGFYWEDTFSITWEQWTRDEDSPEIKVGILQSSGNKNQRFFMRTERVEVSVDCNAQKS